MFHGREFSYNLMNSTLLVQEFLSPTDKILQFAKKTALKIPRTQRIMHPWMHSGFSPLAQQHAFVAMLLCMTRDIRLAITDDVFAQRIEQRLTELFGRGKQRG